MSYSLLEKRQTSQNRRYTPDLDDLLSQCELNYWLISRLVPDLGELFTRQSENPVELQAITLKTESVQLNLQITDVARYTTTLNLSIRAPQINLVNSGTLIIRLYHDAQMMEVMEGSGPAALQAIYDESQGGAKNVDEKSQINRFIGECLRACYQQVQPKATPTSSS